ncbi:GNAT family N-acetyltransferase [Zhouia sp. PK063]|uniref:GNAT family N-acetyltransferase n=1 Tax=Zhouia sp. PK063 TaxID=3373602 RepID=UPI00379D1270
MINVDITFETPDIELRPLCLNDSAACHTITKNQDLWYYFTSDLSTLESFHIWVEKAVTEMKQQKRLAFAVIYKPTQQLIGSTSIANISIHDKRVEIGFTWLAKQFHGTGLNRKVKYILLQYCFEELHCERVEFKTDVLNIPARNALKKLGATEEGVLRSHTLMTNNRRRDTIYYSILLHEWHAIKTGFSLK